MVYHNTFIILLLFICFSVAITISEEKTKNTSDNYKGFWYSFGSGFSLMFISEIGDRTFLLIIFYSMKIGAFVIFLVGALTLLALNFLSLLIGVFLPMLIIKFYLDFITMILFFGMSIYLFYEGFSMETHKIIDDLKEIEEEEESKSNCGEEKQDKEDNPLTEVSHKEPLISSNETDKLLVHSNTYTIWTFFTSILIAEIGDRSQITAIAIATLYDFTGVLIGTSLGHILACLIAATLGFVFAERVSEKTITLIGAVFFLIFGIDSLISFIGHYY